MPSLFDAPDFNARLFFPRAETRTPPPDAIDLVVDVPGARLDLRWHRRQGSSWTVLLFHGNGEVVADYDFAALDFARVGAELAVVDYRGYGGSSGTPSLRAALDDAPLVLARLLSEGPKPLVVMGRSLGSACAAELYARSPAAVRGFIWESGIADLAGLVRRRGVAVPERFTPDDVERFEPVGKLRRGSLPLLVLHGQQDTIIPVAEAQRAFDAAGASSKELVTIAGAGHNDLSGSPEYWAAAGRFLTALP